MELPKPKCLLSECDPRLQERPSERIPGIVEVTVGCLNCGATCAFAMPKEMWDEHHEAAWQAAVAAAAGAAPPAGDPHQAHAANLVAHIAEASAVPAAPELPPAELRDLQIAAQNVHAAERWADPPGAIIAQEISPPADEPDTVLEDEPPAA